MDELLFEFMLPMLPFRHPAPYTDVLPVPDRAPIQTAVSYSQGCPGNAAMENSGGTSSAAKECGEVLRHWDLPIFLFARVKQGRHKF